MAGLEWEVLGKDRHRDSKHGISGDYDDKGIKAVRGGKDEGVKKTPCRLSADMEKRMERYLNPPPPPANEP